MTPKKPSENVDPSTPLFAVTAAAELAGMHPQTLRQYDRLGLVVPGRTQGGSRRYSLNDIQQLREIAELSAQGMSLPAIARLIQLENEVNELRSMLGDMQSRLLAELEKAPGARVFAAGATGVVKLPAGQRNPRRAPFTPRAIGR